jgi:PPP family 3-phenylpropionic acid transporter
MSRALHRRLVAVIIIQYASGGAFLPFISLWARDRGFSFSQLGQMLFAAAAVSAVMPLFWGLIADRWVPVNRLLAALHGLGAVGCLVLSAQERPAGIVAAYVVWCALGLPAYALLNALCYRNLDAPHLEFGKLRAWGSLGWMLPSMPIFLWIVLSGRLDLRVTHYLAAGLQAAFVFAAPLLPHTPPCKLGSAAPPAMDAESFAPAFWELMRRPRFVLLLLSYLLMSWAHSVHFNYAPIQMQASGVPRAWIGLCLCLAAALEVPLFFCLRPVLSRLDFLKTLSLGCAWMASRHLIAVAGPPAWALVAANAMAAFTVVLYIIPLSLAVNSLASDRVRATAQTLVMIAGPGLGTMSGHWVSGQLADRFGIEAAFKGAALTSSLALVVLFVAFRVFRDDGDGRG